MKLELKKAIDELTPTQFVNVILFQEGDAVAPSSKALLATPANKQTIYHFLDGLKVKASSDPIPALKLAFSEHPDVIYLLTDGGFDDNDAVIQQIEKLNRGGSRSC
jgi:hypothetical protein